MNSLNGVMVVGLTGQTGAGKSTVSRLFAESGFCVIDADQIARAVVHKGSRCLLELTECFSDILLLFCQKLAFINDDNIIFFNKFVFNTKINKVKIVVKFQTLTAQTNSTANNGFAVNNFPIICHWFKQINFKPFLLVIKLAH